MKLQAYGNCKDDVQGSGMRSCDIKTFGDAVGIVLFEKGQSWVIDPETEEADFSQATWVDKISSLASFPYFRIYDFEQNTPENEKATSSNGTMSVIRNGKPQFSFIFDKGSCFHKSLYSKSGKDRWDVGILFESGILLATDVSFSKLTGFDMGMLSVETYKFQQATDPEQTTAMIQLVDAIQFNQYHTFITWEQAGFNALDYPGVYEAALKLQATPAALATEVNVFVTGACNTDDAILSLDTPEMWSLGGVQAAATTISAVAYNVEGGYYTLTLDVALAAGDTIKPKLGAAGATVAEDAAGNLFKGSVRTVVTIA